jgi:hypothetical protein
MAGGAVDDTNGREGYSTRRVERSAFSVHSVYNVDVLCYSVRCVIVYVMVFK